MYISAFPTLSFRHLVSLKKECLNPQIFPKDRSFYYFRGANAVYHAVKYLHVGVNDHVLMPAYHCGVEIEAALKANTNVRFFKIKDNLEVDLQDLEGRINQDTKAIFVIHYFGFPQKMDEIVKLCRKYKLFLIEDCAHGLYSQYQNKYLGEFGDVSTYSLQKSLPVCDGGVLVIHQVKGMWKERMSFPKWLTTLRGATLLRLEHIKMFYPQLNGLFELIFVKPAKAIFRMLKRSGGRTFQVNVPSTAHFDISQSAKSISLFSKKIADSIDEHVLVKLRRENYQNLTNQLKDIRKIEILFPLLADGVCPLFLPIVVNDRIGMKEKLERKGVKTFIFGEVLHQSLEKGFDALAEKYSRQILCLPIHQDISRKQIDFIAQSLKEIV